MREITMLHLTGCPYCANAKKAIEALREEDERFAAVTVNMVNEVEHPEIAGKYDYYYVPTMVVGDEILFEAHPGMDYWEIKKEVKRVMEAALK